MTGKTKRAAKSRPHVKKCPRAPRRGSERGKRVGEENYDWKWESEERDGSKGGKVAKRMRKELLMK